MKILTLLALVTFSFLSYSQSTTFQGTWFGADSNEETPFCYDFQEDGNLKIYKITKDEGQVYDVMLGSYYFEEGSDLLVTITWNGAEAITSKYTFKFDGDELILTQTYPNKVGVTFSRELNIASM